MYLGGPFLFVDSFKLPTSTAMPFRDAVVLSTFSAILVLYTVAEAILLLVDLSGTIYVDISFSASERTMTSSDGVVKTFLEGTQTVSVL